PRAGRSIASRRSSCCRAKRPAAFRDSWLLLVSHGGGDDFLRGGHAGEHLADTVLAQRAHAEVARALADGRDAKAFVDHVANFVVEHTDLEDAHAALVAGAAAAVTTISLAEIGLRDLVGSDVERLQLLFGRLVGTGT